METNEGNKQGTKQTGSEVVNIGTDNTLQHNSILHNKGPQDWDCHKAPPFSFASIVFFLYKCIVVKDT